jgi:hypothetical protein
LQSLEELGAARGLDVGRVVAELEGVVGDLLDNPGLDVDPALKALRQVGCAH